LTHIASLNIDDKNIIQHLNDIYVGPECEHLLAILPLECAQEIRLKCLDFYKTAVKKILKRLPYNDPFFELLTFLDPQIALYHEGRIKVKDLTDIAVRIGQIDITKLAFEWRILPSTFNDVEKKELTFLDIENMWITILEHKDFSGNKLFVTLNLLVEAILSLPHSNAEAERIFSIVFNEKQEKKSVI